MIALAMHRFRRVLALIAAIACISGACEAQATVAAATETITLGAAVALTGRYATNGHNTKDGYDLAIRAINEKGGVELAGRRYRLAVKYYDDKSSPSLSAQLVERLISRDGIDLILGPYSSAVTKAVAPVVERHKVPMVEANGADRDLFTQGYRYVFAVVSTSDQYLASAVQLLSELSTVAGRDAKHLKIALAMEDDPFSQDVRDGVIEEAKRLGMSIVIDDKLPAEMDDMSVTLTKVRARKPDLLVVSGHTKGVLLGMREVAEEQIDVPVLATTHCDSAKVVAKYGELADYWLCASQWDRSLSYRGAVFGSAEDFARRFEDTYGYEAPYQAAESAAAVLVYADAIRRAGSLAPQQIRSALAATDMETFYGYVKFDQTGKNIAKPMVLYQIQNGQYKVVAPLKWASTRIVFPVPSWSQRTRGRP